VSNQVYCIDTSVWISYLIVEESVAVTDAAKRLVTRAIRDGRLVAPSWAWAEVGSVLRKKVRQGLLLQQEAKALWDEFTRLPIEFLDSLVLRQRAWDLAEQYGLLTLYDAAFLACTELCPADEPTVREFWTADQKLLGQLGGQRPGYVQAL
jgi:predicted nucleic acid-binding protein